MDTAVQSNGKEPIFVKTSLNERLTSIAVDPSVATPGDDSADEYDVIYVGTTRGKVLKIVSTHSVFGKHPKPVIAEEIQVFPYHVAVNNLQVINEKLIVVSDHEVKALPLHRCSAIQVQTCSGCVALKDPHCAWNIVAGACIDKTMFSNADASELLQDIYHGKHPACDGRIISSAMPTDSNIVENRLKIDYITAPEEMDIIVAITNDIEDSYYPQVEGRSAKDETSYSSTTLTTASLLTAVFALLVGFVSGFLTSRKCSKDNYKACGHHYLEHHLSKQNDSSSSSAALRNESGYTQTPCNNLTSIVDISKNNLLVNLPTKTAIEKNNLNSSTSNSSNSGGSTTTTATTVLHNGTLPRNGTLCKKVYLQCYKIQLCMN